MTAAIPVSRPLRIAWLEPRRLPFEYDDQNIYSGILFPRAGPKMAGLLRSLGYEIEVISGESSPIDPDDIAANFDIACISVMTNTAPHGMILGRWLVDRGMTVVMGGYHFAHTAVTEASMTPTEQALDYVPYVVRGEGYKALPLLLDALTNQTTLDVVGGLSYRDQHGRSVHNPKESLFAKEQINELPLQDWSVVRDRHKMQIVAVHGMQGCPRECSWCAVWTRDGQRNRNTDPARLVDELATSLPHGKFRHVFFSADNFPVIHGWAKEVCREMIARKIKVGWTCQAEVAAIRQTELVDLMVEAGCERWCIGLESINQASLKDSQKRQTKETMEACIHELHRRGIHVHGMFIVGLPNDTPETLQETVEWAERMRIETCQFLCLSDLPGSQDYEQYQLHEKCFKPFDGDHDVLNWMFVNGHYARLANETMDYAAVQDAGVGAMRRFYRLSRSLPLLVGFSPIKFAADRARGVGLGKALVAATWHRLQIALLRLKGAENTRRWRRSSFNRAYMQLLRAEGAEAETLRTRLLEHLPASWLATVAQVAAERRAAAAAADAAAADAVGSEPAYAGLASAAAG